MQGKAGIVALHQNAAAAIDSLVLCKFTNLAVAEEYFARALTAVTGSSSPRRLIRVGERVWNLERLYNLREGFTPRTTIRCRRRLLERAGAGRAERGLGLHLRADAGRVLPVPGLGRERRPDRPQAGRAGLMTSSR